MGKKDLYRRMRRVVKAGGRDQSLPTPPPPPPKLGGLRSMYKQELKLRRFDEKLKECIKAKHAAEEKGAS